MLCTSLQSFSYIDDQIVLTKECKLYYIKCNKRELVQGTKLNNSSSLGLIKTIESSTPGELFFLTLASYIHPLDSGRLNLPLLSRFGPR